MAGKFQLKIGINGAVSASGLIAQAVTSKGKLLAERFFNGSSQLTLRFNSKKALRKAKKSKISIILRDLNGEQGNFVLSTTGFASDLSGDEAIASKTIKRGKSGASVKFDAGRISSVIAAPTPTPTGSRIQLSADRDVYSDVTGGSVIGGTFVANAGRLTTADDTILANRNGLLGSFDQLNDPSRTDQDTINISTSSGFTNSLEGALDNLQEMSNIETINVTAAEDNSGVVDFATVTGAKTLNISGTFERIGSYLSITNWTAAGIRNLDASRAVNLDQTFAAGIALIVPNNVSNQTSETIQAKLTIHDDYVETSTGIFLAETLSGDDYIDSYSTVSGSRYELGLGRDTVNLSTSEGASETVALNRITTQQAGDYIIRFAGSVDPSGFAPDKLEFDVATFTNYLRGRSATFNNVFDARTQSLAGRADGIIVRDTFNNIINNGNMGNGKSWLAVYDIDPILSPGSRGVLYSASGDFINDRQLIATVDFTQGDNGFSNFGSANFTFV